ncbi:MULTISPECIES: hypothetical protein [Burkholderia]|uniref:hypothetical protein n=1 Tax=Burkholderia TaxID=32008 RepID=UPI00158995EB|nr:hypothetical protein [Burkholderia ambifaria]
MNKRSQSIGTASRRLQREPQLRERIHDATVIALPMLLGANDSSMRHSARASKSPRSPFEPFQRIR